MRVSVAVPPAPIVTWEEADAHLRLDGDTDQKVMVERLVAAATGHLDGPDSWLGRALGLQTLEARLDTFGHAPIYLPFPPFVDIVSIRLVGRDSSQTVDTSQHYCEDGMLVPGADGWPELPDIWGLPRIRIQYRAGYAVDPDADPVVQNVPEPIRHAILLMVGDMYRFTETAGDQALSAVAVPMSTTVENLLASFRVYC